MQNASGWVKVAAGFRLVASAAATQISSQGGKAAARTSKHVVDLASNARVASIVVSQEKNTSHFPSSTPPRTTTSTQFDVDKSNVSLNSSNLDHTTNTSNDNEITHSSLAVPSSEASETTAKIEIPPISALKNSVKKADEESHNENKSSRTRLEEGSPIPATRISRALNFASLGLKLTMGTAVEATSRLISRNNANSSSSVIANDTNADILASSLCRMRGAALKIGQMLSIQDETVLPPAMTRALEQVRAGADAMPRHQLRKQLDSQLGKNNSIDWESKYFEHFDWVPIAAASIGQVHKAILKDTGQEVAIKVQYPGVANSIESDLNNMSMLISMFGFMPKGLFMEKIIKVGREELMLECDYSLEKQNQERFRTLLESDEELKRAKFVVPKVIPDLCTKQILTTEYVPGGTIDKVSHLSQEERNRIGRAIMRLTMLELFSWRFMQTDPNWGNFLHDVGTGTTYCIDFGAAREYSEDFVQLYCQMIWAAANKDEEKLMDFSRQLKFFTGDENEIMLNAHKESGFTIGEPFQSDEAYDFGKSEITKRIAEKSIPFLHHRLTPPPQEVYSLHRRIAGSYWLCIKLGAKIKCRDLLEEMMQKYL